MSDSSLTGPVDNTMGAFFLGVIFSMTLWGGACVQLYYYLNRFPRDDWRIKLLLVWVFSLITTHQALVTHSIYVYLISQYGNRSYLDTIVNGHLESMLICGFVCFSVQSYLIHRVWNLSHHNIVVVSALGLLSVGQLISVLIFFGKATSRPTFSSLSDLLWVTRSVNILSAINDMSISVTLIFLLLRSRTGFTRSDTIIRRLVILTLSTGFATSICALLTLITSLVYPNTLIYLAFFICDSALYTNALLATLNMRRSSTTIDVERSRSTYSTSMGPLKSPNAETMRAKSFNDLRIKVDTDTETRFDIISETDSREMRIEKEFNPDSNLGVSLPS